MNRGYVLTPLAEADLDDIWDTAIQISATGTDDYRRWTGYRCSLRRLFSGASRDGRPLP